MKTYLLFGLLSLSLATLATRSSAGGLPCPNERACNVDARTTDAGETERCGVGLTLFGLDLSIGGPKCPTYRYHYPAHQECHGAPTGGSRCVLEQTLNVTRERCECERIGAAGTGLAIPECDCDDQGNAGMIEDFKTEACSSHQRSGDPENPNGSGGGTAQ